jgi:hypothetical protein
MKQLKLPKTITIRWSTKPSEHGNGVRTDSNSNDIEVIERNGSDILSAAIMLEDRMIEAVSKLLFGSTNESCDRRNFFINEIMSTSDFSFAFKHRVFTRSLEQFDIIEKDKIKELKAGLQKVMTWRNAFAHGQLLHEINGPYILTYYSGGHQELVLDDDFFNKVESTIRNCLYTCNSIIQS